MIKYKGTVIHDGPVFAVEVKNNWCNSMGQDNPTIVVRSIVDGKVVSQSYAVASYDGSEVRKNVEYTLDADMVSQFEAIETARLEVERLEREAADAARPAKYKTVRIVRGRKFPIGLEGRIFWIGMNKFGESAGLELTDGRKIFVSTKNLEVISA